MPDPRIQGLLTALNDGREGVRNHAIARLIEIGPAAAPDVIELFKEKYGYAADCATEVLVGIGSPAIPMLINALKHPERAVRWGVADALHQLGAEARTAVDSSRLPAVAATENA